MSKRNRNGAGRLPPFTAVFRHTTKSAAWKALSVGAKATFTALQSLHNDKSQNAVWISARDGVEKFGLGPDRNAVGVWLKELQHYGFAKRVQDAHLGASGKGKSAKYRLTDRYHAGKAPTYDFQSWDGVLFEPPRSPSAKRRKKSAAEIARLNWLKEEHCQVLRTHCQEPTDIRAAGEMTKNGNKCQEPTDIRTDFRCQEPTDISSSPSTEPAYTPPKPPWSTPILTELRWDDDWAKTYAGVLRRPVGLAA